MNKYLDAARPYEMFFADMLLQCATTGDEAFLNHKRALDTAITAFAYSAEFSEEKTYLATYKTRLLAMVEQYSRIQSYFRAPLFYMLDWNIAASPANRRTAFIVAAGYVLRSLPNVALLMYKDYFSEWRKFGDGGAPPTNNFFLNRSEEELFYLGTDFSSWCRLNYNPTTKTMPHFGLRQDAVREYLQPPKALPIIDFDVEVADNWEGDVHVPSHLLEARYQQLDSPSGRILKNHPYYFYATLHHLKKPPVNVARYEQQQRDILTDLIRNVPKAAPEAGLINWTSISFVSPDLRQMLLYGHTGIYFSPLQAEVILSRCLATYFVQGLPVSDVPAFQLLATSYAQQVNVATETQA